MSALTRRRLNCVLGLLLVLTLAFIWTNSLVSRAGSQDMSRGLLAVICDMMAAIGIYIDPVNDHWLRKLAHFCEFGLLGTELGALMYLNGRQRAQGFVNCAFVGLSAAVIDEALQLISRRGSQVQDVLLDFSGFITGLLLCALVCLLIMRRRMKK